MGPLLFGFLFIVIIGVPKKVLIIPNLILVSPLDHQCADSFSVLPLPPHRPPPPGHAY